MALPDHPESFTDYLWTNDDKSSIHKNNTGNVEKVSEKKRNRMRKRDKAMNSKRQKVMSEKTKRNHGEKKMVK